MHKMQIVLFAEKCTKDLLEMYNHKVVEFMQVKCVLLCTQAQYVVYLCCEKVFAYVKLLLFCNERKCMLYNKCECMLCDKCQCMLCHKCQLMLCNTCQCVS